jgi:PucR family transcriptional regulator, purine catabolism regulatory protein
MTTPPPVKDSAVTVRAVLALPEVTRGRPLVLAGHSALERRVRWVHSGDVPNMPAMLKGAELLLTAGLGIGAEPAAQTTFVRDLVAAGVAAVAIELGAAFDVVPPALVQAAEAEGLCLIALRSQVRFVEITEAVHRRIIDEDGELLRRTEFLHQRFTDLLLKGADISDVITELGGFVGNPVVLERSGRGIAYHYGAGIKDDLVFDLWRSIRANVNEAPPSVEIDVPGGEDGVWGKLAILGVRSRPTGQDRTAAERAVSLIAVALMQRREEQALARRRHRDFLTALLSDDLEEGQADRWAVELEFARAQMTMLPVAVSRAMTPGPGGEAGGWLLLLEDLLNELRSRDIPFIASAIGPDEHHLLLLGLRSASRRSATADQIATAANAAARRRIEGGPVVVAVGGIADSWSAAATGIGDVLDTAPMAARLGLDDWYDAAHPDTERMLWSLRETSDLSHLSDRWLEPLTAHDRKNRGDLIKTLTTYCEHGCRKAETARALRIERQTLYHRIGRIEDLLRVDLSDGRTILGLHLALSTRTTDSKAE